MAESRNQKNQKAAKHPERGGNSRIGAANPDDIATEATLNRLESIAGGSDPAPAHPGALEREIDKLNASSEEEVDALRVNLEQDDDQIHSSRYGTGLVADDLARESLAKFTEADPQGSNRGATSVVPGRDDTSSLLRRRHSGSVARSEDVVEGNLDEPRNEEPGERKVDEGTAA